LNGSVAAEDRKIELERLDRGRQSILDDEEQPALPRRALGHVELDMDHGIVGQAGSVTASIAKPASRTVLDTPVPFQRFPWPKVLAQCRRVKCGSSPDLLQPAGRLRKFERPKWLPKRAVLRLGRDLRQPPLQGLSRATRASILLA
jgi:hypothetical protein